MLTSALDQYRQQQRISALALTEARRRFPQGSAVVAGVIATYQLEAVALSFESTPGILAEQGIDAPSEGRASLSSVLTSEPASIRLLDAAATAAAFDTLVLALVQDAGRTAASVDMGRRPAITGYVRSLNLPSCSRCAVLAGRVYRYSTGFQRHPRCDCLMTMTTEAIGKDLVLDPTDAIRDGKIRGLSKADQEALELGADLGQVVNVRRKQAGLSIGTSVIERGGRLTPQGIQRLASTREEAINLLRANRYIS